MASPMVCYEIVVNGKLLSKACVGDGDQFEAALAKPAGDYAPTLSVTVFCARPSYPNKNISWATDELEVGDEITIRVVEGEKETETFGTRMTNSRRRSRAVNFVHFVGKGIEKFAPWWQAKTFTFAMNASIFVSIS